MLILSKYVFTELSLFFNKEITGSTFGFTLFTEAFFCKVAKISDSSFVKPPTGTDEEYCADTGRGDGISTFVGGLEAIKFSFTQVLPGRPFLKRQRLLFSLKR
jgi:hypothetical protein